MGLSYGKLRIVKRPKSHKCPACKQDLVPIFHDGVHSGIPPDEEFEGFVEPEGWYVVKTMVELDDKVSTTYEYDPRRSVNDVLKAIAEAN